ncbi:hypothetical protein OHB41_50960 [Streptomyces sp. NBC_01571]|uniref:hypothetical protein n=1 Tax=Streptomyces sp. NBC_01571 TaxID=2975883 RepID=UPI0022512A8C|nr:hypothetical protein [Streptomyces sp. NBC_01571]MCX4581279.1 hypothetical protein [Streptomyces sp. NBC_01571]
MDHEGHDLALEGLPASVAGCFARSETRETFARMARAMLMELEDVNCWNLAEAISPTPHHDQPRSYLQLPCR